MQIQKFGPNTTRAIINNNKVSPVMRRDDSWPATVPRVMPTGDCSLWSIHYTMQLHSLAEPAVFCLNGRSANPETPKMAKPVLPIVNLMAGSESGSPVSYSSFLVTICLARLVLEIFACERQTDGQTTQTITIAGLHIVAGMQLTSLRLSEEIIHTLIHNILHQAST